MPPIQEGFRAEILADNGDVVTLQVLGELDVSTMSAFEEALDDLRSRRPKLAVIDLTGTHFISAAAFAAIGRCAAKLERLTVFSRDGFVQKILDLLGCDGIAFTTLEGQRREVQENKAVGQALLEPAVVGLRDTMVGEAASLGMGLLNEPDQE